jgi:hypothetical protein
MMNDIKNAVNREDVVKSCMQLFLKIEKKFHEVESNVEEGWKVYFKRQSQFKTFDVLYKQEKRK